MPTMKSFSVKCFAVAVVMTFALGAYVAQPTTAAAQDAVKTPQIPPNKDNDLKFYSADGKIVKGREALGDTLHATQDCVECIGEEG